MKRGLSAACLVLLLLTGCWSYRDINDLALVLAVGIDRLENQRILVTLQIARPGVASGGEGGTGTQGGGAPVYIAAAEGRSVFEAIRNISLFSSRRIMWAHNKIIVIGLAQAEHGVEEIVDFFTRNPELRFRTLIALAEGDAKDVVSAETGMESQPAASIDKAFRYADLVAEAHKVDVKEFVKGHLDDTSPAVLPVLHLHEQRVIGMASKQPDPQAQEVVIQGMAVFRHGKLAGMLDQQQSRGVNLVHGKAGRVIITLPCGDAVDKVSLELVNQKVRIEPAVTSAAQPYFRIGLMVEAAVSSVGCYLDYKQRLVKQQIEGELEASLTADIEAALHWAKANESDPMGLGQHLRAKRSAAWEQFIEHWPKQMSQLRFDLQVQAHLVGGELSINPTATEREKRHGR